MAGALGTFYLTGGLAVAALTLAAPQPLGWGVAALAVATGVFLLHAGHRLSRRVFSPVVGVGTALITTTVAIAPTPEAALAAAAIYLFIVIDVVFFFGVRSAAAHTVAALVAATWALSRADVGWGPATALWLVSVGIALVVGRLVRVASHVGTDALTGLANRRRFDELLEEKLVAAQRSGEPLSLALVDLDGFKAVNDAGGHEAGDDLLKRFGAHLHATLPAGATACRFGGDEFGVLVPDLTAAEVIDLVEIHRPDAATAFSCGVAQLRPDDTTGTFFRRADRALYAAKEAGRGRCRRAEDPKPPFRDHRGAA